MAGWKLRKDKAPAETPGTLPEADEAAAVATVPAEHDALDQSDAAPEETLSGPVFLDTPPARPDFTLPDFTLPEFDGDTDLHFGGLEFDPDTTEAPLTLVDYTEPSADFSAEPAAAPHAQVYDAFTPIAVPPPAEANGHAPSLPADTGFGTDSETDFEADEDSDFEPLPASSSWLSSFSDGGSSEGAIPTVAPFVIDTPVPTAPAAAPQLVVRMGRLSAAFGVLKDVTTIGRPDSALHYYPDIEIEMDDAVSRRHAEVVRREDGCYLVDTGSTNGTTLNGEKLLPHQEQRLAHGDRIQIGDRTEITFE